MELLRARGITKRYPETGTLANDRAGLALAEGEIRALVGENGAGKSTFARILAGLVAPDSGEVLARGKIVKPGSVRAAEAAGIGFVPQVSLLAQGLTVAENIALGREPRALGAFVSRRRAYVEAALLAERFGIAIDPDAPLASLGSAQRRQVEIARALARGGDMLLLDEPTSMLAEAEVDRLFELLRRMTESGKAVILVTHRIEEVLRIADSITVLREGRVVAEGEASGFSEGELARAMARGDASRAKRSSSPPRRVMRARPIGPEIDAAQEKPALEIRGATLRPGAVRFDLSVRAGEIVGVCALAGNGLERLEDIASGTARPRIGSVLVGGLPIEDRARGGLRAKDLAYVPSDREARGLCLPATLRDNALALRAREYGALAWIGSGRRDAEARAALDAFGISAGARVPASSLSGGNRQRLVLARELDRPRKVLLLAEPFQGLDLAAQKELAETLGELAARGSAVLLLSSSAEELVGLADRTIALYKGEAALELRGNVAGSSGRLLAAMAGAGGAISGQSSGYGEAR